MGGLQAEGGDEVQWSELCVGYMMQCVVLDGNLLDEVVLDGNRLDELSLDKQPIFQ